MVVRLLSAALLLIVGVARGATVTGTFKNSDGTAYTSAVTFRPVASPSMVGSDTVTGADVKLTPNSSGFVSTSLTAGYYSVFLGSTRRFTIAVPAATDTVDVTSILTTPAWLVPGEAGLSGVITNTYQKASTTAFGTVKIDTASTNPVVYLKDSVDALVAPLGTRLNGLQLVASEAALSSTDPTNGYSARVFTGSTSADWVWNAAEGGPDVSGERVRPSGYVTGSWIRTTSWATSKSLGANKAAALDSSGQLTASTATKQQIDNAAMQVATVAAMKALTVSQLNNGQVIKTGGYYSFGDGGGASYYYSASSTATPDDGSVIQPTTGSGRFLLIQDGSFNVKAFGPIAGAGYGATNAPRIQAAIDYASGLNGVQVVFSELYRVSSTITLKKNVKLFAASPSTYTEAPSIVTNSVLYKGGYSGGLAVETGANIVLINCDASGGYIRQTNTAMWDDSVIAEKAFLNSGISGLLLQGNDANQTNTLLPLIKACYLWNLTVEDCVFSSASGPTVWFRDCNGVTFRNNYILGGRGVWVDDVADSDFSKNWLYGSIGPSWLWLSSWKNTCEGNHTGNAVQGLSGTVSSVSGNVFTTGSAHNLYTGQYVWVTSTGSVPTPLVSTRPYSVIRITPTTFSLATSLTNADSGTAVTLSSVGSGTISYTAGPAVSFYLVSPTGPSTAGASGTKRNLFVGNRSDQTLEGGFVLDGASENTIASSYIIEAGFNTTNTARGIQLTNSASYNSVSGIVIDNSSDIGISIGQNCDNNVFVGNSIAATAAWEWSSTGTGNNFVPTGALSSVTNIYGGSISIGSTTSGNVASFTGGVGGASIVQLIRSGQPTIGFRASAGFVAYDETSARHLFRASWSGSVSEFVVGSPSASTTAGSFVVGEKAFGSNVAASPLYLYSGQGTGTGSTASAQVRIFTPDAGSSGSTLQTMTERFRADSTQSATILPIWVNHNGTMKRLELGAVDSGGAGYRMLRITN